MREAKYNAAIETHKHCDTISMALVTGMVATSGFSVSLYNSLSSHCYAAFIYLMSAIIILFFFLMYRRSSGHAQVARNVARALEASDGQGISYVLYSLTHGEETEKGRLHELYGRKYPSLVSFGIFRVVNYLGIFLIMVMVSAFIMAW